MPESVTNRNSILGIDIGSVSLSIVQLGQDGKVLRQFYNFHKGNIHSAFSEAEKIFDLREICAVARTPLHFV